MGVGYLVAHVWLANGEAGAAIHARELARRLFAAKPHMPQRPRCTEAVAPEQCGGLGVTAGSEHVWPGGIIEGERRAE